jgi:hypothetical protein
MSNVLAQNKVGQTPMSLVVPLLEFNLLDVRHWMKRPLPGQDAKNVSDRRSP